MTLKPFTLLASSVLILGLGLPAFSAVQGFEPLRDGAAMQGADDHALILASNDDDDDRKGKRRNHKGKHRDHKSKHHDHKSKHHDHKSKHHDHKSKHHDHKGKHRSRDHDDDDDCGKLGCGAGRNPAPANRMAPPRNGLFENGTAPKVQMN